MEINNSVMFEQEDNGAKKWYLPLLAVGVVAFEIIFFTVGGFMVSNANGGAAAANNSAYKANVNTNAKANSMYAPSNTMKPAVNAPSYSSNTPQTFVNCGPGTTGTFSGGNFRSGPQHSNGETNIIAIVDPGATVQILSSTTGEPRVSTGNRNWYKVSFESGSCHFDPRNRSDVDNCRIRELETGYINADLITDCYR